MRRVATDKGEFWVGRHSAVGTITFDPMFQQGVDEVWVRVFVVAEARWAFFTRDSARVAVAEALPDSEFLNASNVWLKVRTRLLPLLDRKAHCHGCGISLEAFSSPVCLKCYWMKCTCGACGCNREMAIGDS